MKQVEEQPVPSWRPVPGPQHHRESLDAMRAPGDRGPVVAMVHGMEDAWSSWGPLAVRLSDSCRMYALDLPWRAGSSYGWRHHDKPADWLRAALAALPEAPDVLIGHSFGANAVLQYLASSQTDGISGAVLLAPFYRPESLAVDWNLHDAARAGFRRTMAEGMRSRLGGRSAEMDEDVFSAMVDTAVDRVGPVGFLTMFLQFVGTTELDLAATSVPTLVLAGENDEALAGERATALASAMPAATVRQYPHYQHSCHVEQPDEVASEISRFLPGTDSGAHPRPTLHV